MKKENAKLPKNPTRKEHFDWLLNSSPEDQDKRRNSIQYKQRLINAIEANPASWHQFAKDPDYPHDDNIAEIVKLLACTTPQKAISKITNQLSDKECKDLLWLKDRFDRRKEWASVGMSGYTPSIQNNMVKEVLSDINFWSKQQQASHLIAKLRDILLQDTSLTQLILNGFVGMNNSLTVRRYNVIDELILEKRRNIRVAKKLIKQISELKIEAKIKDQLISEQKKVISTRELEIEELQQRPPYENNCDEVKKNPSLYTKLLIPMYQYIADRWDYKKKNGDVNRTKVAIHIRKITGYRTQLRTIQTALDRFINRN